MPIALYLTGSVMSDEVIRVWAENDFRLEVVDLDEVDRWGKHIITFRLLHRGEVIFQGERFHCSPLNAVDDDGTVGAILAFCSLRPGDTDPDYFTDYTQAQLDWCQAFGEELGRLAADLEEAYYSRDD